MDLMRLTTSPLVLDIDDVKAHLRIDGSDDHSSLDALQRGAVDYVERECRIQIGTGTYQLSLDSFPAGDIVVPRPPLRSVQSISYQDPNGVTQNVESTAYSVVVAARPGRIALRPGRSWPSTDGSAGNVVIAFIAGDEETAVPETIKHLIRLIVGAWFECREGAVDRRFDELPLPFSVQTLLRMHEFPNAI